MPRQKTVKPSAESRTVPLFRSCFFCGALADKVGQFRRPCCSRHFDLVTSANGKRVRRLDRRGHWFSSLQALELSEQVEREADARRCTQWSTEPPPRPPHSARSKSEAQTPKKQGGA